MLLFELLETVLAWNWRLDERDRKIATFVTANKGIPYHVEFEKSSSDLPEGEWYLVMEADPEALERLNISSYQSTGVTKTGEEYSVWATLLDIVKDFVGRYQPATIEFDAEYGNNGARVRLYRKMFQRVPGYKLEVKDSDAKNTTFLLVSLAYTEMLADDE